MEFHVLPCEISSNLLKLRLHQTESLAQESRAAGPPYSLALRQITSKTNNTLSQVSPFALASRAWIFITWPIQVQLPHTPWVRRGMGTALINNNTESPHRYTNFSNFHGYMFLYDLS